MADEIEAYGSLLDERTKIDRQLKSAATIFQTLARGLGGSPIRLMISNTDFSAPAEIAFDRSNPSIDYNTWPDKAEVTRLLKRRYELDHECRNAYARIPENQRRLVNAPD